MHRGGGRHEGAESVTLLHRGGASYSADEAAYDSNTAIDDSEGENECALRLPTSPDTMTEEMGNSGGEVLKMGRQFKALLVLGALVFGIVFGFLCGFFIMRTTVLENLAASRVGTPCSDSVLPTSSSAPTYVPPSVKVTTETIPTVSTTDSSTSTLMGASLEDVSSWFGENLNGSQIRENLRMLTATPRLAGTEGGAALAAQIQDRWIQYGFDTVSTRTYSVLLSYPPDDDGETGESISNYVSLQLPNGTEIFRSQPQEKPLADNGTDGVVPPFLAYSPPGRVMAHRLVYVNYGREEDFIQLERMNTSVDLSQSVVIARYGKIFRGNKVSIAAAHGAKAILLYSDPADYGPSATKGEVDGTVYPATWWLPPTGVQRGSVGPLNGDPLTPGYPATDAAYRLNESEANLPTIPAHPISYGDARQLLSHISGLEVPQSWIGALPNLTYRVGAVETLESGLTVIVHSGNTNERRNITNVVGIIKGTVEPDRYVVLGNHYDAWVYGALDPFSGTAAMLEVGRVFGDMKRNGWHPRRSLVFASWDAEEYGLVGSVEFVEEFSKVLGSRAVSYINVDILLEGLDTLRFKATPMMHNVLYEASKKVANPDPMEVAKGRHTLYDTWLATLPGEDGKPKVQLIGSGSDYTWFLQTLGIPCAEPRYTFDKSKASLSSYPLYHSMYDSFHLVNDIMDTEFKFSVSVTHVWGEVILSFVDQSFLPFETTELGTYIHSSLRRMFTEHMTTIERLVPKETVDLTLEAARSLEAACISFDARKSTVNSSNLLEVRAYNDQLMDLSRAFIDGNGLETRPYFKNILFAPSIFDSYAGSVFPDLSDILYALGNNDSDHGCQDDACWSRRFRKRLAVSTHAIRSAESVLRLFEGFV